MARLGDDVYEWKVDQVAEWLRCEGLDDCVEVFTQSRINGCKFVNLTETDIKNLHISHESKKTLHKTVEKFKKRKKGKVDRIFGENNPPQRVPSKKPSSFSHDDGGSDEEGWGSDEFSSGEDEDEDSDDGGDYLEPEDDFSKPTGSPYKKQAPPVFQTGLVAQLRIGIQKSLNRHSVPPAHDPQYEDDDDIYDVPPEEEEELHSGSHFESEDLYEEPSDSSGGATVVRPPRKPPRVEDGPAYLQMRGEQQDTYEAPIEGKDISQSPASKQRFIPTRVQPQGNTLSQQDINGNMETYDDPNFASDEDNYEIAEPQKTEAPPPRPPKNIGKPVSTPSPSPARPPKQQPTPPNINSQQPKKTVYGRPPPGSQPQQDTPKPLGNNFLPQRSNQPRPSNNFPPKQPATLPSHGGHQPKQSNNFPQRPSGILPSPGGPQRSPGQLPNKPAAPPKQGSPIHSSTLPPSPTRQTKTVLSSSGSAFQGIPLQPTPTPKPATPAQRPRPGQPQAIPTEEIRPPLVPKARPKPADPMKREPAPVPAEPLRKISGPKSAGLPESPKRREPPRKISDPPPRKVSDPPSPTHRPTLPVTTPDVGRSSPRPSPRGGILQHKDPPLMSPPEPPQKSNSVPPPHLPQHRRPGPLPATPGHERPVEPTPSEPAVPPRPPKHNATQPTPLPNRSSHGDKKGVPLPAPPPSGQSLRDSREQSSGSSMESGSADEPVVPLPNKRSSGGHHHRGLPPTPTEKSPVDMMRDAPWFHGGVDRKRSEANLRAVNMDGAFLVRNSTKNPNDYSLSLLHGGQIRHLQIPKKDGKYVLGASGIQKFDSIIELINYYRQNEVDLVKGGKTKLTVHAQNIAR